MSDSDEKYITFRRQEFMEWMGFMSTQDPRTYEIPVLLQDAIDLSLKDAVIIRRQEYFASPALATYAACVSMVATATKNPELLKIADYFQRQSELAAEEGWKFPDV